MLSTTHDTCQHQTNEGDTLQSKLNGSGRTDLALAENAGVYLSLAQMV